jgi:hypothetical protein
MERNCLSSLVSAENLAAERAVLDAWIPAVPKRPIYSAIRNAFIEHFSVLYVFLTATPLDSVPETIRPEVVQLNKNCTTLTGLLFSRPNVWAARDWRKPPIVKYLLRCVQRSKGGRPLTRLGIAAKVKELKVADSKRWTWPELVDKFCDCRRKEHSISCQDNLRREVLHLEKLLKSCGYPVETGKRP